MHIFKKNLKFSFPYLLKRPCYQPILKLMMMMMLLVCWPRLAIKLVSLGLRDAQSVTYFPNKLCVYDGLYLFIRCICRMEISRVFLE